MKKYSFEKVMCPKCSREYAILKGSSKQFHCPGRNCHAVVNAHGKPQEAKNENVQ